MNSSKVRAMFKATGIVLQAQVVGDQATLRSQDLAIFQFLQAVIPQGDAGGDQVGDEIGVADEWCDFEGAFRRNEFDIHQAIAAEENFSLEGKLGGDAERSVQIGLQGLQICHAG